MTSGVITDSYWRTKTKGARKEKVGAEIRYRYAVGGQTYRGDVISYGDMFFASDAGRLQRYPQGATVQVHYDPKDPGAGRAGGGGGAGPGPLHPGRARHPRLRSVAGAPLDRVSLRRDPTHRIRGRSPADTQDT